MVVYSPDAAVSGTSRTACVDFVQIKLHCCGGRCDKNQRTAYMPIDCPLFSIGFILLKSILLAYSLAKQQIYMCI